MPTVSFRAITALSLLISVSVAEGTQRCSECDRDEVSLRCRACYNDMTEDAFCSSCVSEGLNDAGCTRCPAVDAGVASHCPTCAEDEVSLSCRACYNHMTEAEFCGVCISEGLNDVGCTRCPQDDANETQQLSEVEPAAIARSDYSLLMVCAGVGLVGLFVTARKRRQQQMTVLRELYDYEDMGPVAFHMMA